MLIFWDERIVFLATPKAGSTAIEVALESLASVSLQRPASLKHASARSFRQFVAPWLHDASGDDFTTVALMREPVDWLRSWYRFRRSEDAGPTSSEMAQMDFEQFVESYLSVEPPPYARVGTQAEFLTLNGKPCVDQIFRYENMASFLSFMESRLNCAITLPRINVPPAADTPMSPQLAARLAEKLAVDNALYASL